jgi:hypothetical protein
MAHKIMWALCGRYVRRVFGQSGGRRVFDVKCDHHVAGEIGAQLIVTETE